MNYATALETVEAMALGAELYRTALLSGSLKNVTDEKLRKARANRDTHGIKMAEMDYFQALQHLHVSVENAVSEQAFRGTG